MNGTTPSHAPITLTHTLRRYYAHITGMNTPGLPLHEYNFKSTLNTLTVFVHTLSSHITASNDPASESFRLLPLVLRS